jgi:hypothetical protein
MKRVPLLAFLGIFLMMSCQNNAPQTPPQMPNGDGLDTASAMMGSEKIHVSIDAPNDIFQTDYLAFAVSNRENYEDRSMLEYGSSGYKKDDWAGAKCWNLMFYNAKTQEHYLLDSTRKMLIYNYELNDTVTGKLVRNLARFDVQFDDNKDGKFTDMDAKRLFVSSRLGKGFHQVSPENISVSRYQFSPKENFMVLYGIKDTNKDGHFDAKDRVYLYRLDLNQAAETMAAAQFMVPKEFQDKLQRKTETDWQLPKK